eukprot:COSAG06_NODE_5880_length_3231_cov_1.692848_3_plen_75_part_00
MCKGCFTKTGSRRCNPQSEHALLHATYCLSRVVSTALGSELCASTLLGVRALASPDLLVEIDLVAAKMPDAPSL